MDIFDDGLGWEDMALLGAMSEQIADEERERLKLEQEQLTGWEELEKHHRELDHLDAGRDGGEREDEEDFY